MEISTERTKDREVNAAHVGKSQGRFIEAKGIEVRSILDHFLRVLFS